ncbi:uncharacterized protein [Populus alba]
MAADSEKDASEGLGGAQNTGEEDHEPGSSRKLTKAERIRKQECQRESNARKKQRIESNVKEAETLKETCAYLKGQVDLLEKQTKEARDRTSLKQAQELESIPEELEKAGNSIEKQTAQMFELYELIKGLKHSAGRRECWGSTSSNTEVLEEVPNPMASAMRWNGPVMSGSFKPCQSLPDECNQLAYNQLKELYIASEVRHAQEKAALIERHAKEMAATEARHSHHLEMAATEARHAHPLEMAATEARHAHHLEMAATEARHSHHLEMAATEARHAHPLEMAATEARHSHHLEMAATEARHAHHLEMAATEARHAHPLEMAAVRTEYGQQENEGQALAGASPGSDYVDQFLNYN